MQVNGYNISNGEDLSKFIDVKFICKEKNDVPCQAKVIKVNEEIGKVMLEYVHGGLELVEPNTI